MERSGGPPSRRGGRSASRFLAAVARPSASARAGKRAATELARNDAEELFQRFFEDAGIGMAIVSLDGYWLRVNDALTAILGYTPEELLQLTFEDITHGDDVDAHRASLDRLMTGEVSSYTREKRYVHRDGRTVWARVTGSLIRDDSERPLYYIAQIEDISARKHTEEAERASEERFRVASLSANLGVWSYDIGSRRLNVDENVERLFGVPRGSFGEGVADLLARVSEFDRDRVEASLERAADGRGEFFVGFHADWPGGGTRGLQARGTVLHDADGTPYGINGAMWDATTLLEAEEALRHSEERFRMALHHAPIGMALVTADGTVTRVNGAFCEFLGRSERELVGANLGRLTHPDHAAEAAEATARLLSGEADSHRAERRYVRADGAVVWGSLGMAAVRDAEGRLLYFVVQVEDVTDRRRTQRALKDAEQRFRCSFDEVLVGMAILDLRTGAPATVVRVNPALCRLTGRGPAELEGGPLQAIVHPDDAAVTAAAVAELLRGSRTVDYEARCAHAGGEARAVAVSASVILAADGYRQVLLHVQDITDRKRFEGQLVHLADHDPLTGLFNRRRFGEELEREVATAARYRTGGAVLAIDLDGFKYVNDSMGHAAGDELISIVGKVLRKRLRETDVLARLGGDEFAVILPRADEDAARTVATELIEGVREHAKIASPGGTRKVTASVGIAFFGGPHSRTTEQTMMEVDIALYDAKEAGRDRLSVYGSGSDRQARMEAGITWAERIREALADDRFVLHAQPIMSLGGEERARQELLLRMRSDGGELIAPGSFLEVAERFGLIQDIDRWVVSQAIGLLADRQAGGEDICFEINLSAKSVTDASLPILIEAELAATGADARGLVFEVTETAAIVNVEQAQEFAAKLAELGCEFALDDFGAGFASFYYLKHVAFDYVKIDGEFVADLPRSETNQLVVKSVVEIARGLGKKTIAEFVEDEETVALLRAYGVDYAQGFHIGRPAALDANVALPVSLRAQAEA